MPKNNRPLTYDEKKAAEAAFRGVPFDPQWSEAAQKVFWGISAVIWNKRKEAFQDMSPSQLTTPTRQEEAWSAK